MRRLFGFKSKSSGPLEPLSTNHDSRQPTSQPHDTKPRRPSTTPAPPPPQHGLGLSIPLDAEQEQDESTRSLHAHFAATPRVLSPVDREEREGGAGDPSASTSSAPAGGAAAAGGGGAGASHPGIRPRTASSRLSSTRDPPASDDARSTSPWSTTTQQQQLQRTTSPLSFSPSGSLGGSSSPYYAGGGSSIHPSLARVVSGGGTVGGGGDPNAIYAPTTWSELAHPELVDNVSNRERTRQEILWEVVASEERYVLELRSLVNLYVNPLLHPLLSSPSSPPLPSPPTPYTPSPPSSSELPIAARFSRPSNNSEDSLARPPQWGGREMPEITGGSDESISQGSRRAARSHNSLPVLPRDARPFFSNGFGSTNSLATNSNTIDDKSRGGGSGRLSSFSFRPRHHLRPAPSNNKLRKNEVVDSTPVVLPESLKAVMESLVEMLKGHEELSARLKEQWAKAFPLVRGLAAIWSEQPWFLETYAKYVLSLEEALSSVDALLPSTNSSSSTSSNPFKLKSRLSVDKNHKRLARALLTLEEQASEAGESSLGICLSKPLMRLSKLPLLMQALLYHTDPTTHEWEKTRAMALEVDALVRSIEDEKIDEEAREKTRDALARIEGIKDKALMAPRSSRVLLDEIPVPRDTASLGRRTLSDVSSSRKQSKSSTKNTNEWFVRFSDVTIRCVKIRETDLPGGFSRVKEKQGKQGKVKKGKPRNLYRFVKVERWEMREAAGAAIVGMDDITRAAANLDTAALESSEDDDDLDGAESRMSFRYDADDPKPSAPRTFKKTPVRKPGPRSSSTTQSVVTKQSPAAAKHGGRLRIASEGGGVPRVTSPVSRHRFEAPTQASVAKISAAQTRPITPNGPPPVKRPTTAPSASASHNGLHVREDSTLNMLNAYWKADASAAS
ncbi:hypothetical protein BCR35DRAFT_299782 [Leucosporidium creatinivorum]|uniref:DH domain-containing protein n=1 Tax=Leucosporidium creatinivorum TaxID=106004 RepID=A0A1Y2G377_9BASI|nr:hypothetical protein BCR35DRAFT_299782 [Leucosporidium creatinivorum]